MLHVHRSDRADGLIAALADLLAQPPEDPFAPELIAVPTRGMERWLTQQLSSQLGICANVEFPFPRQLTAEAVARASGIDPAEDPWLPERLVWPLLDVVDGALSEPWLRPLAAHLHANRARRFAAVRHLASLFDRYALHRPELVRGWRAGEDERWQAELWRRLAERLDAPDPAARRESACIALTADPALSALPPRLALFGLTRMPKGQLDVLRALAAGRAVHVFLLHPSPALWEKLAARAPIVTRRADDATLDLVDNRLLASWGQDSRELQLVLGPAVTSHEHPVEHETGTLLARLQACIREDRTPEPEPVADTSVQIHSCHGRARQVEILRDAILHLLAEDPTLEPRDVIVMCPDIETFAPLIQATFGAGEVDESGLRVRLADRSLRQTNPILGVVARALELAEQRLTASQVIDLVDREPVRRRFGLDDDALARLGEWIAESGIRWGLDAEHRGPFKLAGLDAGTWRRGMDRLLVGVTMSERDLFAGVLPLDDVESGSIDLAGRFAELLDRLAAAVEALSTPQTVDAWAAALAEAADALTVSAPRESWQRAELQRLLDDVVREASGHAGVLELAEIRALLVERLQGRPTRANFRTGHLTICTLVPMRSVPHRVVCLLGLDDGAFPRKSPRDGDDLMLDDPHVGERDSRTEDRQMLLDALMAASDRLIVTFSGNDERTNIARPPAVPVGELLDALERAGATRSQVLVKHPLQPFDPRNFEASEPWSFDQVTLDGARALAGPRRPPPPFLAAPLPPRAGGVLEIEDLVRFTSNPVNAFLRQRLDVDVGDYSTETEDALPVELEGLDLWKVGQRLLEARLGGASLDAAVAAETARGTLPPGHLADLALDRVKPNVEEIVARAGIAATESVDVRVGRLSGTVSGVAGDVLRAVSYSRINARQRIGVWVRLLALAATYPERRFEARIVGRAPDGFGIGVIRLAPLEADWARDELTILTDLYDRGMREPLPLGCLSSAAYAAAVRENRDPVAAGRAEWESAWNFDREDAAPAHQLAFDGVLSFARLLEFPPGPDERWEPGETTRFGALARRMWDRLLMHEIAP